jgi:hypothetical protein
MQQIRMNLPQRVSEARADVKRLQELTDWKHYLRRYPQFVLPTIALLAYQLVPRKVPLQIPVKERFAMPQWASKHHQEKETVAKQSFVAAVASAAVGLALRSATSFALSRLSGSMNQWLHHNSDRSRPASREYSRN